MIQQIAPTEADGCSSPFRELPVKVEMQVVRLSSRRQDHYWNLAFGFGLELGVGRPEGDHH
jgi:hypothetical protein